MSTRIKRTGQEKPSTIAIGNIAHPGNVPSDAITKIVSIPRISDVTYVPIIKQNIPSIIHIIINISIR
jgi:hypothetical protein